MQCVAQAQPEGASCVRLHTHDVYAFVAPSDAATSRGVREEVGDEKAGPNNLVALYLSLSLSGSPFSAVAPHTSQATALHSVCKAGRRRDM